MPGLRLLDETNGLVSMGAVGLLLDREGNVWVAANRGVSKIGGFAFETLREVDGLLDREVTAALELPDGVDDETLGRALDQELKQRVEDDAFSGVVLLARNGEPMFYKAYGMADRAAGRPNDTFLPDLRRQALAVRTGAGPP